MIKKLLYIILMGVPNPTGHGESALYMVVMQRVG